MDIEWSDSETVPDPTCWHPLQQSCAYGQAAAVLGVRVRRAAVHKGGRMLAHALVLDRPGLRLILRGPLSTDGADRAARALRRLARHPGLTVAVPEAALCGVGLVPLVSPAHHALWDLTPDPGALRAGLAGKWRNRLSAAEAHVRVQRARPATWEALIVAEAAQRQTRGYRTVSPAFSRALPAGALRVWEWRHSGALAAAMAFVRHGAGATYHLGWAAAPARAAGVHGVMLWQAALALRAEGVRCLDLGSVNTEQAPGLARFKLGTGAALHRLGATLLVLPG